MSTSVLAQFILLINDKLIWAVSETMRIPLYSMSASDLGLDPSSLETELSNILEMVTKWNAILLLDEADVFLEQRSPNDLERNKLVSSKSGQPSSPFCLQLSIWENKGGEG